ncbi:hypothetical protein WJX74_002877 [Apatococcus lobatus]|uniref:Alpha-galactosidase n=1 Tax=Apatococcus lobatus TaxID=904363 RepID=A0AAW1RQW1_9CHLO
MGYNTWNAFHGDIDEDVVKSTADLMVELKLKDAGYEYLVMDDAWANKARGADGKVEGNSYRFPSGIKSVADHTHAAGLKFGIYSDAGLTTCLGYPGGRFYEHSDAESFASWDVDFLKYDNCAAVASDWVVDRYVAMRDALNATGRPILFSLCVWGVADPWIWAQDVGNTWRTTDDIQDNYNSMVANLDNTIGLAQFAGPGTWNDPDLLEVGNPGMNIHEQRAHFALWALLKSPLLISADLRSIEQESLDILLAEELIAVNQDPLGVAGDLIWKQGPLEVYAGPLEGGSRAVVMFNRHSPGTQYPNHKMTVNFTWLGYNADAHVTVRDLYKRKDLGTFRGSFTGAVWVHDVLALKVTPQKPSKDDDSWRPWGPGTLFPKQESRHRSRSHADISKHESLYAALEHES